MTCISYRQKDEKEKEKEKKTAALFTTAVMPTLAVNHLVVKTKVRKTLGAI